MYSEKKKHRAIYLLPRSRHRCPVQKGTGFARAALLSRLPGCRTASRQIQTPRTLTIFPKSTISFSYSINQLIESCKFSFSSHLFWSKNYAKSKERDLLLE